MEIHLSCEIAADLPLIQPQGNGDEAAASEIVSPTDDVMKDLRVEDWHPSVTKHIVAMGAKTVRVDYVV